MKHQNGRFLYEILILWVDPQNETGLKAATETMKEYSHIPLNGGVFIVAAIEHLLRVDLTEKMPYDDQQCMYFLSSSASTLLFDRSPAKYDDDILALHRKVLEMNVQILTEKND